MTDATHAEYTSNGTPVVALLACSLVGMTIDLQITPGSRLDALHGPGTQTEHTTCNYGLNPAVQEIASRHGMVVSAVDETGEVRAVERPDHPYFVATLYQPQLRSTADAPHPVFSGLIAAVTARVG